VRSYDPATTDLSFFRVNIYPGPAEGGLELIFPPIYFIMVPAALHPTKATILAEVTIYSEAWWMLLTANFPTYLFYQGYFLPCGLTQQYQQRSLFTLKDLLPCFGLYQGHSSH
jgi:hypothetical protein